MLAELVKKLLFGGTPGRYSVSSATEDKIRRDWASIELALKQKSPSQLKQALITADKDLDSALRDIVAGETMGERLKNARNRFNPSVYNKIWEAHKVRNNLVHESAYDPPYFVVKQSIDNLKEALISLRVRL